MECEQPIRLTGSNLSRLLSAGRGRVWTPGLARASKDFGPRTEFGAKWKQPIIPRNSWACLCAGEEDQAWLIPHIFFKITNHNQHAFNVKYLANLIRKYYIFLLSETDKFCSVLSAQHPRAVGVAPSSKISSRIRFSFDFLGHAVKANDNFSRKLAWLSVSC